MSLFARFEIVICTSQPDFTLIFGFELLQFFAEAGFPCPPRRNPSDHFLRCINSDFDIVTATLKGSQRLRVCTIFSQYVRNKYSVSFVRYHVKYDTIE